MDKTDFILLFFIFYYFTYKLIDIFLGLRAIYIIRNKVSSIYDDRTSVKNVIEPEIEIIIPIHNESKRVYHCIYSALNQDYSNYSVILVDDGSTNDTTDSIIYDFKLNEHFLSVTKDQVFTNKDNGKKITLIKKTHSGKADSLNVASTYAKGEYLLFVDADTILKNNALRRYSYHALYNNNKPTMIGSIIGVNNDNIYTRGEVSKRQGGINLLSNLQKLEYYNSIFFQRIASSEIKSNFIVSGANFLIKRSVFLHVGGYSKESITEDIDLCIKVIKHTQNERKEYPISYIAEELSHTEVPFKITHFLSQRSRWFQGLLQTFWKYKFSLIFGKLGFNCLLSFLYYLIFIVLNPIVLVASITYIANTYGYITLFQVCLTAALACSIQNLIGLYINERENYFKSSLFQIIKRIAISSTYSITLIPIDKLGQYLGIFKFLTKSKKWGISNRKN